MFFWSADLYGRGYRAADSARPHLLGNDEHPADDSPIIGPGAFRLTVFAKGGIPQVCIGIVGPPSPFWRTMAPEWPAYLVVFTWASEVPSHPSRGAIPTHL